MHGSIRHFTRHYLEMLAAMFIGMGVLMLPSKAALGAVGLSSSELRNEAPALLLLVMAVTMTGPMVAWMRYRGHGWPASSEMAAAMFVPTFGVIGLLWARVVTDLGALMVIEHVVMLASMLGAMLLRLGEYTGAGAGGLMPRVVRS